MNRLVALNAERAAEEARGIVHWLRPEFQNPEGGMAQQEMETGEGEAVPVPSKKLTWPRNLPEQVQVVRSILQESAVPMTSSALAGQFTGARRDRVSELLETLVAMGKARVVKEGYTLT